MWHSFQENLFTNSTLHCVQVPEFFENEIAQLLNRKVVYKDQKNLNVMGTIHILALGIGSRLSSVVLITQHSTKRHTIFFLSNQNFWPRFYPKFMVHIIFQNLCSKQGKKKKNCFCVVWCYVESWSYTQHI